VSNVVIKMRHQIISTRGAGVGIKPGVERSGTPGRIGVMIRAHEVGDRSLVECWPATVARSTGSEVMYVSTLGFRCAPPQAYADTRFAG
jgi:hypothetical protein